ncbi:hypothetical protein MPSEU_001065900 [Mayamaea pseudoterrestris]|nr:hypothetical protein MPSEU_001065900 [Mayamaea pseudoterrestris]
MAFPVNPSTPLIANDAEFAFAAQFIETQEEIASHWKVILFTGIVNIATGIACLCAPVIATQVVEIFLVSLIFVSGIFNVVGALFFSERRHGHQFFWMGLLQILIAVVMYMHPFGTLAFLTFFISFVFMMFGSFQMAIAMQNARMGARGVMFLSGALTVILSVIILMSMPMSAWITIGVLVGANLVNIGLARIGVACYGRSMSGQATLMTDESWRRYVDYGFI